MQLSGEGLVVLGMHRSGTSVATQAARLLGVYLGEDSEIIPQDPSNSDGYWENRNFIDLNHRVLTQLDMIVNLNLDLPDNWRNLEGMSENLALMRAQLLESFAGRSLWGWKDPRTTLLVPMWQEALSSVSANVRYAICVRSPLSVAISMERRRSASRGGAMGMWLQHTLAALKYTKGCARTVLLYEDFLRDPEASFKPLVDVRPGWHTTTEQWAEVRRVPKRQLDHGKADEESLQSLKPSITFRTYDLARRLARDPSGLIEGAYDDEIDFIHEEFSDWWALNPSYAHIAHELALRWEDVESQTPKTTVVNYAPQGTRQSFQFEFRAAPGTRVFGSLCDAPRILNVYKMRLVDGQSNEVPVQVVPLPGTRVEKTGSFERWTVIGGPLQFGFAVPSSDLLRFEIDFSVDLDQVELRNIAFQVAEENFVMRQQLAELATKLQQVARDPLSDQIKLR